MKAIQITRLDGPDAVELAEVAAPESTADQVLIRVRAAGVAFPEVLQTRGRYQIKPPLPFVPGAEVAGEVMSAPAGSDLQVGARVCALTLLGGFAEQAVAAPDLVFALPDDVSFDEGAGLPFNYLTAHFGLIKRGRLTAGETVLVHGAAGGVGVAAIGVAKAFGARVIAVASTPAKAAVAAAAGADDTVSVEGFKDAVKELTGGRGVDIVVDPVGGDRFTDSLRSLAPNGRLLVIGFTAGEIPTVQVNRLLLNNIDVVGVGWGAFVLPRPGYVAAQWAELLPYIASGAIRPPAVTTMALAQAADALGLIDRREVAGKVILNP